MTTVQHLSKRQKAGCLFWISAQQTGTWIILSFDSLSVLNSLESIRDMKLKTVCVCVCVCVDIELNEK